MRYNFEDLTGQTFGRLTALRYLGQKHNKSSWLCRCTCGNEKAISKDKLKSGGTVSCGCFAREWLRTNEPNFNKGERYSTHGMSNTKEYRAWCTAKHRCYNPNYYAYERYGGRGIKMHAAWIDDFEAFFLDVGLAPSQKHWLDRIDNDLGYEPGNVRWVLPKQQNRNRWNNKMITIDGVTKCMSEWCELNGINKGTAHHRIKSGIPPEKAVTLPPDLSKSRNHVQSRQVQGTAR